MSAYRTHLVLLAGLAFILLHASSPETAPFVKALPLIALLAIIWRAARERGAARAVWALFAAAVLLPQLGYLAGELTGRPVDYAAGPQATLAWLLLGISQVALAAAIWRAAVMRGPRRDPVSMIDGLAVAAACMVPLYVIWIGPQVRQSGTEDLDAVGALAFPLMNLFLVALAIRAALGSGRWSPSSLLLIAGLGVMIATNIVAATTHLEGGGASWTRVTSGWMAGYLLWAAAAAHPSASSVLVRGARRWGVPNNKRIGVVLATALIPLVTIAIAHIEAKPIGDTVVLGSVAVMTGLLGLRLVILARAGSNAWKSAAVISFAGFMVLMVGFSLTRSQTTSDRQRDLAVGLLNAAVEGEQIDALTVRVLAEGRPASARVVLRARTDMRNIRHAIEALEVDANGVRRTDLEAAWDRYVGKLLLGQRFVAEGRVDDARAIARGPARRAHRELVEGLSTAADAYRVGADRSARSGRIGSVIVLFGSLVALTLLVLRFGTMRRDAVLAGEHSRAVEENERRIRALIDGSPDIITIIDPQTRILAYSSSAERMLGYPPGSLRGAALTDLLEHQPGRDLAGMIDRLADRPGAADTLNGRMRRADGRMIDAELSVLNKTDDEYLGGFLVNVRDVTERRELEAQIEHQSLHDPLTGLPNRGLLEHRLQVALRGGPGGSGVFAMVVLDVDDFKAVNDTFGHAVGDALLIEVGERMRGIAGEHATVARIGGDEFAMLCKVEQGLTEVRRIAGQLLEELRRPIDLDGHWQVVRVSIGVAVSDTAPGGDGDAAKHLLRNAELAMYEAKRPETGDIEVFEDELHVAVAQRLALRNELEQAIAREELVLHYQPIVDLATQRTTGYEALVRWIHPERGMVSPADFIPIAESSGLIVELGRWVMREACRQLADWQSGWEEERYVAVNVAGQQLGREAFIDEVIDALHSAGLPARQLVIEVTETGVIRDTEGNERRLDQLRELGVGLAVDDFGTGYSSLSYLHRFPFDLLKIDKSFIDRVTVDEAGRALVEAMIRMADSLALRVVAEGIEEPEQVAALSAMDCMLGQGYNFSRPLPAADVPQFSLPGDAQRRVA